MKTEQHSRLASNISLFSSLPLHSATHFRLLKGNSSCFYLQRASLEGNNNLRVRNAGGTQYRIPPTLEPLLKIIDLPIITEDSSSSKRLKSLSSNNAQSGVTTYVYVKAESKASQCRWCLHGTFTCIHCVHCILYKYIQVHIQCIVHVHVHQIPHWECPCSGGDTKRGTNHIRPFHHLVVQACDRNSEAPRV